MDVKKLKVKTQKISQFEEGSNEVKEKYVNIGYEWVQEDSSYNLDNLAFHFTPRGNFASIQATGLRPKIGSNSSGVFGKEALEKTFFSYGRKGVMQLFNRLVTACCQSPTDGFRRDVEKEKYLLNYQKNNNIIPGSESLTILEGLEYARRYMQDCSYFGFDAIEPQYSKVIDEAEVDNVINSINNNVNNLTGIKMEDRLTDIEKSFLISKVDEKISKIKEKENSERNQSHISSLEDAKKFLLQTAYGEENEIDNPKTKIMYLDRLMECLSDKEPGYKEFAIKLSKMRAQISIGIREKSKIQVDEFRGTASPDSLSKANFERIDYNEEKAEWVDVYKHPHNVHTMITESSGEKKGVIIGGEQLGLLSFNGTKPATAVELTKYIFETAKEQERSEYRLGFDPLLIEDFYKYVDLYEQFKGNPKVFKEELKKIESELIEKYGDNRTFNVGRMSDDRMDSFTQEVIQSREVFEK